MKRACLLLVFMNFAFPCFASHTPIVVIATGHVYVETGSISFSVPELGNKVKVNAFGQYRGDQPEPVVIKQTPKTRHRLAENYKPQFGEILTTKGDGFIRLLFDDKSILDVGPNSVLQFLNHPTAIVSAKLASGRFRMIIPKALSRSEQYWFHTPSLSTMARRGGKLSAYMIRVITKDQLAETYLLSVHSKLSVDVSKLNGDGLLYKQPFVVEPSGYFMVSGPQGLAAKTQLHRLTPNALLRALAQIGPQLESQGTAITASPLPELLPGTGQSLPYRQTERLEGNAHAKFSNNFWPEDPLSISKSIPKPACSSQTMVGKLRQC